MAMLPKKAGNEPGLQTGAIVIYENDGRPLLAAVLSFKNQKYQLLNQRGREIELPSFRLHLLPSKLPADAGSTQAKSDYLQKLADAASVEAAALDLAELWSFVEAEEREYETSELAKLYFGDKADSKHLTLHLALVSDRIFFKRKDSSFSPRPSAVVEDLKKSEQSRLEKLRLQELMLSFFRERLKNPKAPAPGDLESTILLLTEVAAGVAELDNNRQKDAKEILDLCSEKLSIPLQGSREARAYQMLERVGLIGKNTNLAYVRHRFPFRFPTEVERKAQELRIAQSLEDFPSELRAKRQDLSALNCFTVDDVSTRDMDDAISIERTRDGFRLGIHITDVASFLTPESALDRDALSRATSLYAPERTVHMLPTALAEDKLSLKVGAVRATLSCLVDISHDFAVRGSQIVPSLIKVRQRYNYDEVDRLLEDPNSELNTIYNIASTLEAERLSRGALKMGKREKQIILDDDGDFHLIEIDEDGPARSMIGEMMVLANAIMASWAAERNIPLIYRGQEPPDEHLEPSATIPEGPAADYQIKSKLKKSFTSVSPVQHSSLALKAYIQATSPIRRYADIVNQRQILSVIQTGKAIYSGEDCRRIIENLESPLSRAQAISKETRRFWLLRAFEKLAETQTVFHGTVLRIDLKNPLVEMHELLMPVLVKIPFAVKPGDEIKISVLKIDSRNDYLRLEAIQ